MSDRLKWAREIYKLLLNAIAARIAALGIHPNVVSLVSLVPAICAGISGAMGYFWLAAILLLVSGILDLLDGALARLTGQTTRFGALLDSTLDRLSDSAVLTGLVLFYAPFGIAVLVPVLAIISGFTVSYVRARAEGLLMSMPRLWMRREDRLLATVGALLLAPIRMPGQDVPAALTLDIIAIIALLSFIAAALALKNQAIVE